MATLNECKSELNSIIRDLENAEWEIRRAGLHVGEDKCADLVAHIAERYRYVQRKLDSVDYNRLAEWFLGEN